MMYPGMQQGNYQDGAMNAAMLQQQRAMIEYQQQQYQHQIQMNQLHAEMKKNPPVCESIQQLS